MTNSALDWSSTQEALPGVVPTIQWRSRYDGLVAIAQLGDKAIAGISGPWDGKFALTWWDRPLPSRQLELFDSLAEAKLQVEAWNQRMRDGQTTRLREQAASSAPAANGAGRVQSRTAVAPRGLLERLRTYLPARASHANALEQLRRERACFDGGLEGLHFAANE